MAISTYEKDGKIFWQVYIDIRSKSDRTIRIQKRINGIETEKAAISEDKKLFRDLTEKLHQMESAGIRWKDVIDRWLRHQELYPSGRYTRTTIVDYVAILRNWTTPWLNRVASEINRGDGREVLQHALNEGKKHSFRKHLKSVIHLIYTWGIEERMIKGVHESPVKGIELEREREEKIPEILTLEEIRTLLLKARQQGHPWYPIWVTAVFTGCRNGELLELKRSDLELISREDAIKQDALPFQQRRYGFLRVRRNWNTRLKIVGPTKAGYWRTVPVSSELYWFLVQDRKVETLKPDDYILPHSDDWKAGYQAVILRGFCQANQLPSLRFHALRACFATQLISAGIPATVVMKIAGWKDMKTMQRYIRMAGIDEAGATEILRFIPTDEAVMEHVVSLVDYRIQKGD